MELKKCNRCGGFFVAEGLVCPKCSPQDKLDLNAFKNYIEEYGLSSVELMSVNTGISEKNLNRFLDTEGINLKAIESDIGNNGITLN